MSIEGLDFPRAFVNGSIQTDQVKFPFKICRHIFWHHYSAKLTFSLLMALLEIDIFVNNQIFFLKTNVFFRVHLVSPWLPMHAVSLAQIQKPMMLSLRSSWDSQIYPGSKCPIRILTEIWFCKCPTFQILWSARPSLNI